MILERLQDDGTATLGILRGAGRLLWTLERPWLGNMPFESCVPPGEYELLPTRSTRHGVTWALSGYQVTRYKDEGVARYAILFHAANRVEELEGCIAPGLGVAVNRSAVGLQYSGNAMRLLRDTLGASPGRLVILPPKPF